MKAKILESMETLIKDGESLTTGNYTGGNPEVFTEFAEVNGFDLQDVISVYEEHKEHLQTCGSH